VSTLIREDVFQDDKTEGRYNSMPSGPMESTWETTSLTRARKRKCVYLMPPANAAKKRCRRWSKRSLKTSLLPKNWEARKKGGGTRKE